VRKLKIFLLAVTVIGFISLAGGCKKTYTTVVQDKDTVFSSGWLAISDTGEIIDNFGDTGYVQTFQNSAITSAVVSDGVVLSYLGYLVGPSDTGSQQASELDVLTLYQVGSVTIESFPVDDGGSGDLTTAAPNSSGVYYRYVIIPGNVLATMSLTPKQAKSMSYTAITAALDKAKQSSPASITP
jgi:hypothetical protein